MTSIDDLPIPSPSLGHQLSHSDSLDSLSEYGSQRLRLINGGSSREAAESPRRRSSVLSSLSPLTHSTTCSIGLKTGLSSEHLSREQARAKKEMPSPPATTRGSDNASTDSRDRFTPPGVGTEDGHRSSLGHLRSRSSPQRSPTFKRSSLARLSMQREPEDEHEELDAPVASSSRRSSLALDRSPRRLNSPGVVRSESTGSSRQKHRLGTAAQQRERNQRLIDNITSTINAPPRSPSKRRTLTVLSSDMTRTTSSSSSTLSPGPRDTSRSPSPQHRQSRTTSPDGNDRLRKVSESGSDAFALGNRLSVISLSSGPIDVLAYDARGKAGVKGKATVREQVQSALDGQASKRRRESNAIAEAEANERRRWRPKTTQNAHVSSSSRFDGPRAQTSLDSYPSMAVEILPRSAERRRRSGTPLDLEQHATGSLGRRTNLELAPSSIRTARANTVGPRNRPPIPREFMETARQIEPVRSRTPSVSSLGERNRFDSQSSSSPVIAATRTPYLERVAPGSSSNGSVKSRGGSSRNKAEDSYERARTISPSPPSTRSRRSSEVGSERWWNEVDEIRQRAHDRPTSRASTAVYDTLPSRPSMDRERERTLRVAHSAFGIREDAVGVRAPSRTMSTATRRSRTSLGQHADTTNINGDASFRSASRLHDVDDYGPPAVHHDLLSKAVERCNQYFRKEGSNQDLLKQITHLAASTVRVNSGLKTLIADATTAQVQAELNDESTIGDSTMAIDRMANHLARTSDESIRSLTELLLALVRHERERDRSRSLDSGNGGTESPRLSGVSQRATRLSNSRPSTAPGSSPHLAARSSPLIERSPGAQRSSPRESTFHGNLPAPLIDRRSAAKSSTASDATVRRSSTSVQQLSPGAKLARMPSLATSAVDSTDAFASRDLAGLGLADEDEEDFEDEQRSRTFGRSRGYSISETRAADALRMATTGGDTLRRNRSATQR